jgi:Acetyltransferase (GNAT) domain
MPETGYILMGASILPILSVEASPLLQWDSDAVDACSLRTTENSGYWSSILTEGAGRFVDNYRVRVGLISNEGQSWPVTSTERIERQAYPASLYSHYIAYPCAELGLVSPPLLRRFARVGFSLMDGLVRMARIDKTVQWSSWLLSTNLHAPGIAAAAPAVTAMLVRKLPRHAVLVRNLHSFNDVHLLERFEASGYDLYTARQIYFFDGRRPEFLTRYNVKHDLKCLKRSAEYRLVGADDITEEDVPRITELYRLLYLDKHCGLNPAYNIEFVRRAWRERWLVFRGLRHSSGRLDAVCGYFFAAGVASTPFFGHDTSLPTAVGLYRMLMAQLLQETADTGRILNYSSGAGAFKRHRGAIPVIEYNAIYTRHLAAPRRAAFVLLRLLVNGPGRKFLESSGI